MIDKLKNFKNLSPAAKASIALLFANLVLKGLSMISGPIFTRLMTTSQYGVVSTFMSWQSMLMTIVTLNLGAGVFNNGMLEYKDDRDCFQFSLTVVSTITAVIFLAIYLIFPNALTKFFEMPAIIIYILVIYYIFVPVYGYWSGRQRYEFKYKALTCITIAMAVVSLVIGLIVVLIVPEEDKALARIISSVLPNIVVGMFFFGYIAIKAKFKAKLSYIIYALKFNIPLLPHYLSMYVLSSSDRIMISKMVNTSATAIYSVAYTVGMVISIVWQSIEASLSPWIYEKMSSNDEESIRKRTFQIMLFFAVICMFCALFAPEIIAILAPAEYYSGVYVIPSIAASAFFIAAYSIYMRVELYYKQTFFATIATTISAVLNLLLNYICIREFGFIAAGYTTLACYIILFALHYINVKKQGYGNVFDNKKMWILSIMVTVASVGLTAVYSYVWIRYTLILLIIILALWKRKEIINILKKS